MALSPDRKLRLLPSPWPSSALPQPTSSLLSVASTKGLVAAAGPDALVVARTDALRAYFTTKAAGDGDMLPREARLDIPMPYRLSQVAFSSDERYLVISAESGGGLAVYDVQALMQPNPQPTFQLPTNGNPIRALIPNPTPERAELFAIVGKNGDLMMANLQTRQFISGPTGPVLRQNVSCLSWSTRGKQLVAGLADGTAHQMTPEGEAKAELPRPPLLSGDAHGERLSDPSDHSADLSSLLHNLAGEQRLPSGTHADHVRSRQRTPFRIPSGHATTSVQLSLPALQRSLSPLRPEPLPS